MKIRNLTPLVALLCWTPNLSAADDPPAFPELEAIVRQEMEEWGIGGVSVALIDDQKTIYLKGFGEAKEDSVFRVGSISKLFNAVAVMQQVEAGKLDLDAPIDAALLPTNPFPDAPPVTLRQLLCHRSGLQRETAVGSYFDDSEPGIEATVASLHHGVLVTRPGEVTRYSNIGPTLAGHLVEKASGMDFVSYQKEKVLKPLGMSDSAWLQKDLPEGRLVKAHMRVADGKGGWTRREAPVFDLGTIPAGNLYAPAGDLARFASALLADGGGLLKPETLAEMWTPQLTDSSSGFGLGFAVGKYGSNDTVSHTGAVYGFSSSLIILPGEKLAVVVLINEDIADGRVAPIREAALSALLERKQGQLARPNDVKSGAIDFSPYVGDFESESFWAKLWIEDGTLVADISGQPTKLTRTGDGRFLADSRINFKTPLKFGEDKKSFQLGSMTFHRVQDPSAKVEHPLWENLLGSYGKDFIPIVISSRYGHLYAMTENMVDYRLTPINQHALALPPGMYVNEQLIILPDEAGKVPRIDFCNVIFDRRSN